jgi:hypothetical protein
MKDEIKEAKEYLANIFTKVIIAGFILGTAFHFIMSYLKSTDKLNKEIILFINEKAVCDNLNKNNSNKCKLKGILKDEDKNFFIVEYKKNGKTVTEGINKNIVYMIIIKNK